MHALRVIGLLAVAACGASSSPPRAVADPRIAQVERGLLPAVQVRGEDVRFRLADRMRELSIPGVSIAVFENYELVWARAYGVADADTGERVTETTMFQAASISKSGTALAAMLAVEEGALALDAPINDALRSWKLPDNELTRATPVTLRHLLGHTAGTTAHGFPGYASGEALPALRQVLDGQPPSNTAAIRVDLAPGTKFRYSGGGTTIVQTALIDRLGKPYPAILAERVLRPLGMTHSTYEQPLGADRVKQAAAGHFHNGSVIPGKRHTYPEMAAAGLWTTPSDLARFFLELQRALVNKSPHVSRSIATQMTTGAIATDRVAQPLVGLGLFLSDRDGVKMFGHNGANEGFQARALASMAGGYGVVIMANSDRGTELFPEIERAVFAAHGWPGADKPVARVAEAPSQRARWAGRFVLDSPFTIAVAGDQLELRRPFEAPVELVPIGAGEAIARDTAIRYKLAADGGQLELISGGRVKIATRLADSVRLPVLELAAGREAEAAALWRALAKEDPARPAIDEKQIRSAGYARIRAGDTPTAIALFRFVATMRPDSANAANRLGGIYASSGDTVRAIAAYESALAALPRDTSLSADDQYELRMELAAALRQLRRPGR